MKILALSNLEGLGVPGIGICLCVKEVNGTFVDMRVSRLNG